MQTSLDYSRAELDARALTETVDLMRACFPKATHFTSSYLGWLYCANPVGNAFGFNVRDGGALVGHFVGIPQRVRLKGREETVILLLNIATHPDYRGRGLFIEAIRRVLSAAADDGFAAITGVANALTYRGYEKLGFQNVTALDAYVGVGAPRLDTTRSPGDAELSRSWDETTLRWRMRNPVNPLWVSRSSTDHVQLDGHTPYPGVKARAVIAKQGLRLDGLEAERRTALAYVMLGLQPRSALRLTGMSIPARFRPSPLRLVYKNLRNASDSLEPTNLCFTFLDFDAF